jgi:GNAT superfamily N-acetyltransferase
MLTMHTSSNAIDYDPFAPCKPTSTLRRPPNVPNVVPAPPALYYRSLAAPFSGSDLSSLQVMRTSCGLYADRIPRWSQEVSQDRRRMYFIYLTDPFSGAPAVPIGMISLNLYNTDDPSLACYSTTGRVEVSSLFVYQAYRHLGVGLSAMMEMERRAAQIGALYITLNTMATPKNLQLYSQLGYREFKPRCSSCYSSQDILGTGAATAESAACFMEKPLR